MMGSRPGLDRVKRKGALLLVSVLSLLLFSLPASPAGKQERLQQARQRYELANRLRSNLEGTPKDKRSEDEYNRVAYFYRRVYDLAPFSALAATALANAAEVYHDMGKQFGRKYWHEALETYRFLRREYPYSKYRDDALFNMGQIQHVHLGDLDEALETYGYFLKKYPDSRYAATVRNRIQAIKAERAAAYDTKDRIEVRNIRFWNTENYTRVVVDLEDEVKYQKGRVANPDRIFFDLFNTELSGVLNGKTFEVEEGLLNRIRVAKNRTGVSRVVLEISGARDYNVFALPNPFRLVVDIYGPERKQLAEKKTPPPADEPDPSETVSAAPPEPPAAPKPTTAGDRTLTRVLGLKVGRIVIDPGHGGHDTGTIGPTGLMEKDLTLDVARRLKDLIEEKLPGAEVFLTRDDDTFVPLENRIALANQKQADLFLSIHANSSPSRSVRGVETFVLNVTTDPRLLELAARENAVAQKSIHELQDLVSKITRNEKLGESRELATQIQKNLYAEFRQITDDIRNRGVKQAPFVVLIGGNMPSVLTEIAFLSNPRDEKLLKSADGRQRVARALFNGVTSYLENLNSIAFASTAAEPAPQD